MKPRIKFSFECGCDPFWSDNALSVEIYGISNIPADNLNFSEKTLDLIQIGVNLNETYLNPLYQMFPSFWSEKLCAYFNQLAEEIYQSCSEDLGDRIELVKGYSAGITEDERLAFFLSNPVGYCLQKGISFGDSEKFKAEVREQEEIYRKFTKFTLSGKFGQAVLSGKKSFEGDRIILDMDEEL